MWFMEESKGLRKYGNYILAFAVMAVNVIVMAVCFDFYYDLNDDTMMKDIMSGVYSGMPDGHNMQTLYPLGAFIALCYRLCRDIPWYGLFLCLCQFGCFWLIGARLCALADYRADGKKSVCGKMLFLLILSLFQWAICLEHLINIQYTITCAIMSATAIFLFQTSQDGMNAQRFVVNNIPSVILVIVSYQLRSEMLLLTIPFICLAGLYRMAEEKKMFAKESLRKYGAVIGLILAGMMLSSAVDYAAYNTADWKDFRAFFDARTMVYDFYPELVTREEHRAALNKLGVTTAQQTLLNNYNFALDDAIDTRMLTDMADYASRILGEAKDWAAIAREQISFYIYRTFHGQDAPYNIIVLWAYAAVAAAGVATCRRDRTKHVQETVCGQGMERGVMRRYAFLWQLVLLAAARSAVWLFILMRGRDPVRITHPLYLVEFVLLLGLFVRMICARKAGTGKNGILRAGAIFLILLLTGIMTGGLTGSVSKGMEDQIYREKVNADWWAIDAYCREHPQNFYFEDVYSTVAFSQKIFGNADSGYANYDILGGWICKSPLYREKLRRSDIVSAGEALIGKDGVYMIISDTEVSDIGTGWIAEYYGSQGVSVTVEEIDRIGEHYFVYQVREE